MTNKKKKTYDEMFNLPTFNSYFGIFHNKIPIVITPVNRKEIIYPFLSVLFPISIISPSLNVYDIIQATAFQKFFQVLTWMKVLSYE